MTRIEYLLSCLSEECAEVIQRVTKAQRFGLKEIQPGQLLTNEQRIGDEVTDIIAVLEMLTHEGLMDIHSSTRVKIDTKKERVETFFDYSKKCGTLSDTPNNLEQ